MNIIENISSIIDNEVSLPDLERIQNPISEISNEIDILKDQKNYFAKKCSELSNSGDLIVRKILGLSESLRGLVELQYDGTVLQTVIN
ncbi:hypothetical protein FZC35_00690 [Candidatus Cytomitobacter indipagum]|uniref:Uncharacterized protein n=1 Tax=Candidatus Cytomitobacter indipagum TaxID=2601575 RepID=A0A5C0UE23_9PROT|nr:hypothetical protein [Candidatus Cytomitobacter indipagum]QEK37903.1 hypothetical protein FZC35_00690 [Candidatus Cytomitobacter indipagum]